MHRKEKPPRLSATAAAFGSITLRCLIGQENNSSALLVQASSANTPAEARFRHLAEHLHQLGPRPTYELLREIAAVVERLERYAALTPEVVHAVGAAEMPLVVVVVPNLHT
jgi:hypothetical protein